MERYSFFTLLTIATQISSVEAMTRNSDIIGMAVAGCVSFVLLSVVIAFIVITFHWRRWFNGWMQLRGKVRMPRGYIHKKEDVKRRLITPVSRSIIDLPDPGLYESVPDVKAWTEGSQHMTPYRIYEDKDATIELGDEDDETFTIETEVIDDEVPKYPYVSVINEPIEDGPVKVPEEEEHTYSTADSFKKIKQSEEDARAADGTGPPSPVTFLPPSEDETPHADDEHNAANHVRITAF